MDLIVDFLRPYSGDRILVIEGGRIVEQGTHNELLARAGVYYQLYRTGFEE